MQVYDSQSNPIPSHNYHIAKSGGAVGCTSLYSGFAVVDALAFCLSTTDPRLTLLSCDGFGLGYLYHVTSGLCITGRTTTVAWLKFQDSDLPLDYCDSCGEIPLQRSNCAPDGLYWVTSGHSTPWHLLVMPGVRTSIMGSGILM
jgi:hypothetical protein